MSWTILRRASAGALMLPVALLGSSMATGCDSLEVSDPTAIEASELGNPTGVNLLRGNALRLLYVAFGNASKESAIFSDEVVTEWPVATTTNPFAAADRREPQVMYQPLYTSWQSVRRAASIAIPAIQKDGAPGAEPRVGEMFAVRGFAELRLAEDFCPGFPLFDLEGFKPDYGGPLTTDEALGRALIDFDSALVYAADSIRISSFARVARGRTLLALGRFADAAVAVGPVATTFVENATYSQNVVDEFGSPIQFNPWWYSSSSNPFNALSRPNVVANREGGNGIDFVEANDPRLKLTFIRMSNRDGFSLNLPAKYPNFNAPIVLASGIEARLIEAEAALKAGGGNWLAILNDLRATRITPAMAPLPDPGNEAARVNLLFRERAFWLYGTGHRLADMRRLISRYGRAPNTVFPTGAYRLGGEYSSVTNLAFDGRFDEPFSPSVTGCTSR
jgi:starch-binding outer membrane protein, SusD/RagB family